MENGMREDVLGELSTEAEAEVEGLVRATALREGLAAPEVRWSDAATSKALFGGRVIELRRTILRDSDEARFVALHELGHVALGHQRPTPAGVVVARLLLAQVGPVALGPVLAWWIGFPVEWGLFLGVVVAAVLWALGVRRWLHPREYAADRWAAERGGVLTKKIARRAYGWPPPWRQTVKALWVTHPAIFRRVSRVSNTLPAGNPAAKRG